MSVQSGTLGWDEWFRGVNWRTPFDLARFVEGDASTSFTALLHEAMRRIEREIPSGRIHHQANLITNNIGAVGFDGADMRRLLADGHFRFDEEYPLWIHGPTRQDVEDRNFASAPYCRYNWRGQFGCYTSPGYRHGGPIHLNYDVLFAHGRRNFRGDRGRMIAFIGGTVLHEVMHLDGFQHVDDTNDPRYDASLPEVAGQAFVNLYYPGMTFLTGGGRLRTKCGVESRSDERFMREDDVARDRTDSIIKQGDLSADPTDVIELLDNTEPLPDTDDNC